MVLSGVPGWLGPSRDSPPRPTAGLGLWEKICPWLLLVSPRVVLLDGSDDVNEDFDHHVCYKHKQLEGAESRRNPLSIFHGLQLLREGTSSVVHCLANTVCSR